MHLAACVVCAVYNDTCACVVVSGDTWSGSDKNSWDAVADTTDPFSVGRGGKKNIKTNRINYYTVVYGVYYV